MKLTRYGRMLSLAAILSVVLAILLTPLGGFETRPVAQVKTTGYVTLGLFFAGLILNLISVILIFSRTRLASTLAIIGTILFFPVILADQTGLFSSLAPPTSISYLEVVLAIDLIVVLFSASEARRECVGEKVAKTT